MFCSEKAIEFWNDKAERFLHMSRPANSFYNKRHEVIETLVSRYSSPSTALDIGSAEGDLVVRLSHLGYDAYGTDISARMIKAAIAKTAGVLPDAAARFRLTQGQTPPFVNPFDLVTAIGVLPYVTNHRDYIHYLSSMLNKKGILIITCSSPFSLYNIAQTIRHIGKCRFKPEWLKQLKNLLKTGLRSGGFVDHPGSQVHSASALKKIIVSNGYKVYETVSFYNIRSLDKNPAHRGKPGRMLSGLLGWTHLAVAQKVI